MKQERIGFIGLGLMGKEMARHLLHKGYPLTVMGHRNREPLEALCRDGAEEAKTPADMAAQSDIVFICVKTSEQVSDIIQRSDGLLASARPGLVIIDCSTARPDITEQLAAALAPQGATLIDAPLARTPREAREGRLNVMVGGEEDIVARVTPIIESFAENVFHVGETGSAHKLKLINNFLSLGAATLAAEAASMANALGVSQHKLLEICSQGGANSAMLAPVMEWVLERECTKLKFSLGNAEKDMRYLTETLATYQTRSAMLPPLCEFLSRAKKDQGEDSFVPTAYDTCVKK